ncbi:LAETG motif-containing sortase-dependent surface protein [Streptomyces sp. NPDC059740]|uniref:LAETG motif-containing sortase-dependent surface protein n=1 Tax=Streptomyces sp. NPDC059740 TaxID=3346926 RepID=UPI0036575BB6
MMSVKKRGAARLAAATLASGLFAAGAIGVAGSAAADEAPANTGGASATLEGLVPGSFATAIDHTTGKGVNVSAGLFSMKVADGGTLQSYCIDFDHHTQDQAEYSEVPWKQSSLAGNPDAGKIRWILQHSYPQVNDLAALASQAGAGKLTPATAAAGTQVAIWRFSDHKNVDAVDKPAEKLADWLQKNAVNAGEPAASLSLTPAAVSGKSGGRVGPVTVHTNAGTASVAPGLGAPAGVKVVDGQGNPVTTAKDGQQLFFDVPAGAEDGSASLTLQARTKVPVGRAFTSSNPKIVSQTQILAGSSDSSVSATATATWAKQGPIPALSAAKDCAKGGVDVTAANKGDEAFSFELAGKKYEVAPGKSQTITVPVTEDQAYKITVTGDKGFSKTFTGILDCKTTSEAGGSATPSSHPSAASVGGTGGSQDLAETGSSSATPVIAGIAVVLVVVGGGAVFFLRKKKTGNVAG